MYLDPHSADFVARRDEIFADLREHCPVAHSTAYGGFHLLTRYADVRTALADWRTFSSAAPGRIALPPTGDGTGLPLAPLELDPPRQQELRALVDPYLRRPVVEAFAPQVRALADSLVTGPELDVVRDLALPLVSGALGLVLGLPPEAAELGTRWAQAVFADRLTDPAAVANAQVEMVLWVEDLLAKRRAVPRDDAFTALALGDVTAHEALGYGINLLLAGRDATVDAITTALWHLAVHPQAPQDLPRAVEELLRLYSPIHHLARVTTRQVVVQDVTIPAGAAVAMCFGSANRDPRAFPDAGTTVLNRRRNAHLAFGAGVHHCPGAHLARLDVAAAVAAVLARQPFSLGAEPVPAPNGDTRGFDSLILSFYAK
jgi:cytochrome P450